MQNNEFDYAERCHRNKICSGQQSAGYLHFSICFGTEIRKVVKLGQEPGEQLFCISRRRYQ